MSPYRADPDEGPSDADRLRFGDAGGYCPECGRSVYDDADVCPGCGSWITGEVLAEPPSHREVRGRFRLTIIILVLLGFLSVFLGLRIF